MRRRQLLKASPLLLGGALLTPKVRSLWSRLETNRIQQSVNELLSVGSPALASDPPVLPKDDARHVWPVSFAYLRMISQAEGCYIPGMPEYDPYRVLVGSTTAHPLLVPDDDKKWIKHPADRADEMPDGFPYVWYVRGTRWSSWVAGAYQFHPDTYAKLHERYQFDESIGYFAPKNQDLAALYLTGDTGGHWHLRSAISEKAGQLWIDYKQWQHAVFADSREWASLPGHDIGASTGQSTKAHWKLWTFFNWGLWELTGRTRKVLFPVQGYGLADVTDRVRWRSQHPVHGDGRMHWGTDIGAPEGTPIVAPENGVAKSAGYQGGAGNVLHFQSAVDPSLELVFFHNQENLVGSEPVSVEAGQSIALVGSTGDSTGPHAHIELRAYGGIMDSFQYLGMAEWFY